MRAAFRFLGRGSWLARRDPRVPLLVALTFVTATTQLRDIRHLLVALILAFGYYALARIPWRAVRVQWIYLAAAVAVFSSLNAILTGGGAGSFEGQETHVLFTLPLGIEVTAEGVSLAAARFVRFLGIAAVSFPVAYAIAPGDLGLALRRLHLGDRLSVMVDLAVRFIPTVAHEFSETLDAQRVRGYDPTARGGGLLSRVRRVTPLFVPVTVGSLAGAEDTIDAMDLRGFGTGKRVWFRELHMDPASWVVVLAFLAFLGVATWLNFTNQSEHLLLPFLVD
jgi:energy-coupling factor transport system permease protein